MTVALLLPAVAMLLSPSVRLLHLHGPGQLVTITGDAPLRGGRAVAQSEDSNPVASTPYQKLIDSPILTYGDVAALLTFAAIGRGNHGAEDGSLLGTAAPFLAAWLAAAPPLGAYNAPAKSAATIGERLRAPLPAIAVSVPCGCALRGLFGDHMPALPFWIVSLVAVTVLMSAWRSVHYYVLEVPEIFVNAILDDDD